MSTDHRNPGCTDPASQSFARHVVTRPTSIGSASSSCSDGEIQIPSPDVNGTVQVTDGGSPIRNCDGERQYINRAPVDVAPCLRGTGLPAEVSGDAGGVARPIPATVATCTAPPAEVDAGRSGVRGLPENVFVR
jgi:hypothetical protein